MLTHTEQSKRLFLPGAITGGLFKSSKTLGREGRPDGAVMRTSGFLLQPSTQADS